MQTLNLYEVQSFVNQDIVDFHERRIKSLYDLNLDKLLKKNPYLYRAKNIATATLVLCKIRRVESVSAK